MERAICEAITGPDMRFGATKTPEQQSCLMLYGTRQSRCRPKDKRVPKLARACPAHSAPAAARVEAALEPGARKSLAPPASEAIAICAARAGALAVIRYAKKHGTHRPWLAALLKGERYKEPVATRGVYEIVPRLARCEGWEGGDGKLTDGGLGSLSASPLDCTAAGDRYLEIRCHGCKPGGVTVDCMAVVGYVSKV